MPSAREIKFAHALLDLWSAEGGECPHGLGFRDECEGDEDGPCRNESQRAPLRWAFALVYGSGS